METAMHKIDTAKIVEADAEDGSKRFEPTGFGPALYAVKPASAKDAPSLPVTGTGNALTDVETFYNDAVDKLTKRGYPDYVAEFLAVADFPDDEYMNILKRAAANGDEGAQVILEKIRAGKERFDRENPRLGSPS